MQRLMCSGVAVEAIGCYGGIRGSTEVLGVLWRFRGCRGCCGGVVGAVWAQKVP